MPQIYKVHLNENLQLYSSQTTFETEKKLYDKRPMTNMNYNNTLHSPRPNNAFKCQ